MTRILLKLVVLAIFLVACSKTKETKVSKVDHENKPNDSLFLKSDMYLTKLTELKKFNGVVLLKKGKKTVLRKAYNISSDTLSKLYVNVESQFDLRSVSKLFAKVSVLRLENEGKINRSDTIGKYLPGFPNGERITIQHLMDNSSGLPREFDTSISNTLELSPDEIVTLASKEKLEFEPGSEIRYSNIGFQLLYYIIGKTNKSSYSLFLKENFFKPLKMKRSGGNFDADLRHLKSYAYGHYVDDEKNIKSVDSFLQDEVRMGNLHSSVDDLAQFLTILNKEDHASLIHDHSISHAGGTRGKRAYIYRNFSQDYSIVFLTNYDEIPFEQLISDLENILESKKVKMPKAVLRKSINLSPLVLKKYEGTYDFVDAGHLLITLKVEKDSLFLYQKEQNNGVLYPESENVFFGDKTSEESIKFVKNESGNYYILMDFQGVQWEGVKVDK
ncbi:serine hydrolase domain-containing protein [Aquimarina megaterium]|uniref:serine hydrolase domain-containing protein n=1 Tax=Aquimarina megaterium TaxID=1443666 RepID=UPI00094384EE|nr:serine hydrolase domain-containing protein [Aquimarina megaterium]